MGLLMLACPLFLFYFFGISTTMNSPFSFSLSQTLSDWKAGKLKESLSPFLELQEISVCGYLFQLIFKVIKKWGQCMVTEAFNTSRWMSRMCWSLYSGLHYKMLHFYSLTLYQYNTNQQPQLIRPQLQHHTLTLCLITVNAVLVDCTRKTYC